jgi:hypothetical protein
VAVQVEVEGRVLEHAGQILNVELIERCVGHGNFPVTRRDFGDFSFEPGELGAAVLRDDVGVELAVGRSRVVACMHAVGGWGERGGGVSALLANVFVVC